MRSGLQVSEYDSYDYELSKNGISEERTDGAYILVKDVMYLPHRTNNWFEDMMYDLWH